MQQGDRLSMAWAVELRLPFVDYRLVETAIGLRKTSPDHMLPPKARFREVIKDYLPEWVLNRPKTGFTPPIHEWIGTLNRKYNSELAKGYLVEHGVLNPSAAKWLAKPGSRVSAGPATIYKSLVLEWWARGMSEAAKFKPASQLLSAPRPRLTAILSKQERFVKPLVTAGA
jgi:asparagine synthase (glutamine-hydrolysing)